MFVARAAAGLTIVTTAAVLSITTAAVTHAMSCDRPINGIYTATSDGNWSTTRGIYLRDQATVVAEWTVTSDCDDVMHCAGHVTSQQGWSADLRCQSGQWYTTHRIENWQPCPDGTSTYADQAFRFWRMTDDPESFDGYDRTIGPSGACGVNQWPIVEMPFSLTKIG